jgi:hypothetical protein
LCYRIRRTTAENVTIFLGEFRSTYAARLDR